MRACVGGLSSKVSFSCKSFDTLGLCLGSEFKVSIFYYLAHFFYYSWIPLHFLLLFMSHIILFQLTFIFIYSIFSKKFLVSAK